MIFHRLASTLGLAVAVSLTLGACGSTTAETGGGGDAKIDVVASTNVYGSIAEAIGGDKVDVHSIITRADADPHSYEATPQDKLAISKAAVAIENGAGYDDFFDKLAKGVLDPSKSINVATLSGFTIGADFNEHLWYSMPTMAKLADEVSLRLGKINPADGQYFEANAKKFKESLTGIQGTLAELKKTHNGEGVAITEPVPLYMLEEVGLENKTPAEYSEAIENGSDVPATVLRATIALMSSGTVDLLAYNDQTQGPQTLEVKQAADAAKLPVVNFTETLPTGEQYLGWMTSNAKNIGDALKAGKASGK